MFNAKDAISLLKKSWNNPAELAQEIYSLATNGKPIAVDVPLSLVGIPGKTSLHIEMPKIRPPVLGSTPTPSAHVPTKPASADTSKPKFIVNPGIGEKPTLESLEPNSARPANARVDQPNRPPVRNADGGFVPSAPGVGRVSPVHGTTRQVSQGQGQEVRRPESKVSTPSEPARLIDKSSPKRVSDRISGPVVTAGGEHIEKAGPPSARPPAQSLQPHASKAEWASPYASPPLQVDTPASFTNPDHPVQFATTPVVLNKRTGQYERLRDYDQERLTHIPRGKDSYDAWIGKVKSGTGQSWIVTIYPDGMPPTVGTGSMPTNAFDATVTVPSVTANHLAPVGEWIGPILEISPAQVDDPNPLYYFPPHEGRIAVADAGGIPARSGTTPGKATGNILYTFDGTNPATVDVASITVYNWSNQAVVASAKIQVKKIEGMWFVDVEDC